MSHYKKGLIVAPDRLSKDVAQSLDSMMLDGKPTASHSSANVVGRHSAMVPDGKPTLRPSARNFRPTVSSSAIRRPCRTAAELSVNKHRC
jgi:hypothetical protein